MPRNQLPKKLEILEDLEKIAALIPSPLYWTDVASTTTTAWESAILLKFRKATNRRSICQEIAK